MKILEDNRGVARVIEAFLASMLLMSCLAFIPTPTQTSDSTGNLVSTAQNLFLSLDSNGHLAALVDNRNWNTLESSVESALPLTTWFNLTVFDKNMNVINPFPLSNAGSASDKVVSVDYVCTSQNGTFAIYVLRLQLSEVGSN